MHSVSVVRTTVFTLLLSLFLGCSHTPPVSPTSLAPVAPVSPVPPTSVVKVHDGDTITVLSQNASQRLRLTGIDCPESDQPYGAEATETAIQNILLFLQFNQRVNTAFPPFHAKFPADTFLPKEGDCLVVDPCAGWGGRLLGTLCVNRTAKVRYFGIDPETRNKAAYKNLLRRVQVYLKAEVKGPREADFSDRPFEDWVMSPKANAMKGTVDLVITSPPYFRTEIYNAKNARQSTTRYKEYDEWREKFYRALVQGAYDLLKPNGVFVLNIADVASAKRLEKDARILAREAGFENAGFYKLAMSVTPWTRNHGRRIRHRVVVNGVTFKYQPVFCLRRPGKSGAGRYSAQAEA